MTPSLQNFLLSLLAGGLVVLLPLTIGLVFISQRDKIQRG
jgi:photosystem II PsbX protein